MSKKLTPLEALEEIKSTWNCMNPNSSLARYSHFDIIETALKDYERRLKLAKEYQDVNNVAKRLKALEIIKEKRIDVATLLDCHNVEEYNRWVDIRSHYSYQPLKLTQEEWDLLKEILEQC